jgi:hypothetical protein
VSEVVSKSYSLWKNNAFGHFGVSVTEMCVSFTLEQISQRKKWSWVPESHEWKPSYLGGSDSEDGGSRPATVKRLQDPISTNSWVQCCLPVIPATWEAEFGAWWFQVNLIKNVCKTLISVEESWA